MLVYVVFDCEVHFIFNTVCVNIKINEFDNRHSCQVLGSKPQSDSAFLEPLDKLANVYQSCYFSGIQWHGMPPLIQANSFSVGNIGVLETFWTRTSKIHLDIRRLKHSKCLDKNQVIGINQDILAKIIYAQPIAIMSDNFLASHNELIAIGSEDLRFKPDSAFEGMIRKTKLTSMLRSTCIWLL